jgi:hypothetical protein
MSAKAISWAWRQTGLTPVEKCVLMALADFHTDASGCFPSIKAICEKANIKKTAAINSIHVLESRGLIKKEYRNGAVHNQISNYYSLNINDSKDTPRPLNAPSPRPLKEQAPVRKKNPPPRPLNERRGPLNGPKLYKDNNTDTSYQSDPLEDFLNTVSQDPPTDMTKLFWRSAVKKLRDMAVPEPKARMMIGKWLKATGDNKDQVMSAIDEAVAKGTMEPVSFVTKILDKKSFTPHKEQKRKEVNDVIERLKAKGAERRAKWEAEGSDAGGGDGGDPVSVPDGTPAKSGKVHLNGGKRSRKVQAGDTGEIGGSDDGHHFQIEVPAVDSGFDF